MSVLFAGFASVWFSSYSMSLLMISSTYSSWWILMWCVRFRMLGMQQMFFTIKSSSCEFWDIFSCTKCNQKISRVVSFKYTWKSSLGFLIFVLSLQLISCRLKSAKWWSFKKIFSKKFIFYILFNIIHVYFNKINNNLLKQISL